MGSWSAGVWGNDTAEDLKFEYQCAFYRYDPEEAVRRLDEYVRTSVGDESDTIEWCNYIYSLADFMWKKGILTEAVKTAAVSMIDSGFGLDEWEKSGKSVLAKRRKALEELRTQLLSPMPERKPIRPKIPKSEELFTDGDYIAVRLLTKDKPFSRIAGEYSDMTDEEFHRLDGKYIIMQKVCTETNRLSELVPEFVERDALFRLFDDVYDTFPSGIDTASLRPAKMINSYYGENTCVTSLFLSESRMTFFRKRKAQIIGHGEPPEHFDSEKNRRFPCVYISLTPRDDFSYPDAELLSHMGRKREVRKEDPGKEMLSLIATKAERFSGFDPRFSMRKYHDLREKTEAEIQARIRKTLNSGAEIYTVRFGKLCGFAAVRDGVVENVCILPQFQRLGLAKYLLRELRGQIPELRAVIPDVRKKDTVRHICETLDIPFTME